MTLHHLLSTTKTFVAALVCLTLAACSYVYDGPSPADVPTHLPETRHDHGKVDAELQQEGTRVQKQQQEFESR